ncbi:MAG: amidohydrolase family protein [Planctomycetes bacterium]|nr:amidohydrolase family protein [Planctomycetota bacterium]
MNARSILTAAFGAALCTIAAAQDVLAVKAGKILTVSGPTIENGVVLMHNGRITKVAKAADVEIPWDAKVVDASDKTVMPTWVLAHTQGGIRGANENLQNVPYVSIADAVDPAATWFEDCLRNGVGTVHAIPGNQTLLGGSGMILRPYGRTVEDMAVVTSSGVKLSLQAQGGGRLQQIRRLRKAIEDVQEYLADFDRRKKAFEEEKKAGAIPADKEWTEEHDRLKKPVIDLLAKKTRGWLYVPGAAEVDEALRLSQQFDLVMVFGPGIHKAIPEIAKLKAAVVIDDALEFYETDDETQQERKICPAKQLADAGVPFALSLATNGPGAYPWWQMATCVRNGIDRRAAIEALTLVPARILGIEKDFGSLTEGKLGNLQILTGDPLAATTWVDSVILEGQVVYERSKDPRLQYLFSKEPAKAAAPATPGEGK